MNPPTQNTVYIVYVTLTRYYILHRHFDLLTGWKLKNALAHTSLAPLAWSLKPCSIDEYAPIISANVSLDPSGLVSCARTGSKCWCLSFCNKSTQYSSVAWSFFSCHLARFLSAWSWVKTTSVLKKQIHAQPISIRNAQSGNKSPHTFAHPLYFYVCHVW